MDTNQHITDFLATKDLPYSQTFELKPQSIKDQTRLEGVIRVKVLVPPDIV